MKIHLLHKKQVLILCGICLVISGIVVFASVLSVDKEMRFIENKTMNHFNNWESEEYDSWVCSQKSEVSRDYICNELGFPCILVYGHSQNFSPHKWVLVFVQGSWHEFETTCFSFQTNEKYYGDMFSQVYYQGMYE